MRAKDFLKEFAPDGFEQFKLYTGDSVTSHYIDKFSSLKAAKDEVEFLWDTDPETQLVSWFVKNLNDEVVWYYDPQEIADAPRWGRLKESTYQDHEEQIQGFIKWCAKKLKIKQQLPKIRFQDVKEGPDQHRTGYYDDNNDIMWIYTGNRNLIDIMRTVAHELTHRKQHEDNMVKGDQSYPGSPIEQQADAIAGYLMKLYGKENPEIIE